MVPPTRPWTKLSDNCPRVDGEGKWDEGKKKYVEEPACNVLRKRLAEGQRLTDAQWCKALLDAGVIRVRNRWPEGEDFAISMRQSGWLGVAEIRMKPRTNGLKEAKVGRLFQLTCGTCMAWDYQAALCQPLGRLPPGKHKIVFDVTVERGEEGRMYGEETKPTLPPGILWKGEMSFDVEVVKSVDDCVAPVKNGATDQAVRNALGIAFSEWYIDGKTRSTAIFVIDPDVKDSPLLADTALSLKVEILKDGRAVDELHVTASDFDRLALAASVSKGDRKSIGFCPLTSAPATLEGKQEDCKSWSIRVSGTSKDVVYLWDAKRRWNGSVEIPIDELIERERARTKGKERVWIWTPSLR